VGATVVRRALGSSEALLVVEVVENERPKLDAEGCDATRRAA